MSICNKTAEENTKANLIGIGITTVIGAIIYKDFSANFLKNTAWNLVKYEWNNNESARNDAIRTFLCKLGF